MPAWQPVEGEGLLDRLLGPVGEPGIFGAPSGEPLGEIGAGLGEVAPVVEPAQFLPAVVVGLPWQVIERVPQEVHEIGRASCRERGCKNVWNSGVAVSV